MKKTKDSGEIIITELQQGMLSCYLVGTSPLIQNQMASKALHELLLPPSKSKGGRDPLKHDVLAEFKASAHIIEDATSPTLLGFPASGPKKAMATAAMDLQGSSKAQIGRLVQVQGELIPIFGTPQILLSVTRAADIKKTPDVRTRLIVPRWAAHIRVSFTEPMLNQPPSSTSCPQRASPPASATGGRNAGPRATGSGP